ncbi:MAG: hypothetical protein ACPGVL_02830 [Pseudoalteromonas spongiae]
MDPVSTKALNELFKHGSTWLVNLSRAKSARKSASVKALRKVITSSRETAVYIRQLNDTNNHRDHERERYLSMLWTELGFELEDLGINNLAKRCQIKGKHWSDPQHYHADFLQKADISLDRMERIAREVLAGIKH